VPPLGHFSLIRFTKEDGVRQCQSRASAVA
jgi:hypothetical protein